VYESEFESAAGLWPFVASRIITALMVAQLTLLGVLSLKLATKVAPYAIPLPVMTYLFSRALRERFEANFVNHPLEVSLEYGYKEGACMEARTVQTSGLDEP
jgi:hypothetical protein